MKLDRSPRRAFLAALVAAAAALAGAGSALYGQCGPFTDVTDAGFCPFVLEIFTLGITTGTSPTTYDPTSSVSRLQMAAFLSRTVDGALRRGSRGASLEKFWTTQNAVSLGLTTVGAQPGLVKSDGSDVWVANTTGQTVSRVRASDGKLLETWTGAVQPYGVLVAMGRVLVTGETTPGMLFQIDPTQPAGAVATVASTLGSLPSGIAFDGSRVWTANGASVSIVTPQASIPWTVTNVSTGFTAPIGALYDGTNIWVTDNIGRLFKLDANGAILQTITVAATPKNPVFDGSNIWVPSLGTNSVAVVRASNGAVLATLTTNGLVGPIAGAFDGQRVLIANLTGNSVSLWKAADITPLGSFSTGAGTMPNGACSDGVHFWITLLTPGQLARF
jgi:hypothetical protein